MKEKTFGKANILLPCMTVLFLCLLAALCVRDGRLAAARSKTTVLHKAAAAETVNINTADAAALAALPGIGDVLAQRIIEHREVYGPFGQIEELTAVPGIGWKLLDKLEGHITTDGGGNE